ncbi:NAD-dependent succinate-semialdehyde dehydrogenase [Paenibacillus naphthalenovorans]|uniref:NAD-dependent succinate-semialdehyde dehydrogenase n=1 Tax=Paenibacillus naphthalenovorans TaxID=162209 RepID=UPI003D269098
MSVQINAQSFPWLEFIEHGEQLKMYINGQWVEGRSGEWEPVEDPSSKNVIAYVSKGGAQEAKRAVEAAQAAFGSWSMVSARERSKYLYRLANLLREHALPLASLLTAESGKVLKEAMEEIRSASAYVSWYSEEAMRINGTVVSPANPNNRIFVLQRPVGVVVSICPFNFPFGILARKLAASVAAGCTFTAKPAPETPLTALMLARLVEKAGFPQGVVNIITGDAAAIGKVFCEHPAVRKITFTGSTQVGRLLTAQAGQHLKQTHMELGGNSPCIIFPDADQERAVKTLQYAKFRNTGQVCGSPNRIYVHESIAEEFIDRFYRQIDTLKVGPGHHKEAHIGPLIHQRAIEKVDRLVKSAVAQGAEAQVCGKMVDGVDSDSGYYYLPVMIRGAQDHMDICREETFGPVATFLTFKEEDEVVSRAVATPYGLAGFVYTKDVSRVLTISEKLEVGNVGVNGAVSANIESPFGGVKESGWGREGGKEGLYDFLETVTVSIQV